MCLEKNILYEDEKDYLLKYTDNVPYKSEEIDYELLDILEKEYNIKLEESQPINSGIIGIVFNGLDISNNNSKILIKLLKKDIENKLKSAFDELECLTYIIFYIPYLNNLNLHKSFLDNKETILNQLNFVKEVNNIEIFKLKNKNLPQYRIPYVYKEITNNYNNVIVMENIKGLTIHEVKKMDKEVKENFGELLVEFALIGLLYNNAIHADLHSGNIFFYINTEDSNLPKYQIGIIDFGICVFPLKENQNIYYKFFNEILLNNNYSNLEYIISNIITEKEIFQKRKIREAKNNGRIYKMF